MPLSYIFFERKLNMKKYLKKVLIFALTISFFYLIVNNLLIFPEGKMKISLVMVTPTIIILMGYWIFSFLFVGLLKLISIKIDNFIYHSNKMIFYSAMIFKSFDGLEVLLFHSLEQKCFNNLLQIIFSSFYFMLLVIILYYFWKYRLELAIGLFISNYLRVLGFVSAIKPDYMTYFFKQYFGIENISNVSKGLVMLLLLGIFLTITIYLRKKGVYDYRSKEEQNQEKVGEGYYSRF